MTEPAFGTWPAGAAGGSLGSLLLVAAGVIDASTDVAELLDRMPVLGGIGAITSFPGPGDMEIELWPTLIVAYPAATQWYALITCQSTVPRYAVAKFQASQLAQPLVCAVRVYDETGALANCDRLTVMLYVNTTPGV